MPVLILADDPLATWGEIAAIILAIELFVFVLLALGLSLALMFAFAWVREKAELVRRLRPGVDGLNRALATAAEERPLAEPLAENPLVRAVVAVPGQVRAVDQRIERGSDRVAEAVIEVRARTLMVKQMARAFFLPGLTRREQLQRRARQAEGVTRAEVGAQAEISLPTSGEEGRPVAAAVQQSVRHAAHR